MRLVSCRSDGQERSAVLAEGYVYRTDELARLAALPADPLRTNLDVIRAGPAVWSRLAEVAATSTIDGVAVAECEFGPPVGAPEKLICVGLNYFDHAAELGLEPPPLPVLFAKFANSLSGPRDPIVVPAVAAAAVDYEGELAVVIGRRCRDIVSADALHYVFGVMAMNDVTARDLQRETSQWLGGKALDTFAPCSSALVTLDEVDDIQALAIRTRVNGELVQDGTTAEMVHSVADTIAFLSRRMTLIPGDIISTGTPAGVGDSRDPKLRLVPGDLVEVEVDGIGATANRVEEGT